MNTQTANYENAIHRWSRGLPWLVLLAMALLHVAATGWWLSLDNQPPLWDMAMHQGAGLRLLDYYQGTPPIAGSASSWWDITGAYPPFYHHLLASAFLLGRDHHLAVWSNLPATLALLLGTFLLGRRLFSATVGLSASAVLLGFPYMAWMSRETVIDYTLAAVVLWAIIALEHSEAFSRRSPTLAFGLLAGGAAMTKWIGPLFLVLPVLAQWCRREQRRAWPASAKNFLDAVILGAAVALPWYWMKVPDILGFLKRNAEVGAAEGEPPVVSFQSAIYYLRLLEGEQLHALFFVGLLLGTLWVARRGGSRARLLFWWILSGYLGLTLLRTKDPRFTLPYLPAVALLVTAWITGIQSFSLRCSAALLWFVLAASHFGLVSFGFDRLPQQVVLAQGYRGSFHWDWRLYAQRYMNLLGPPRKDSWPQSEILERLASEEGKRRLLRLGIIPDLPRFNHENLRLQAQLMELPFRIDRIASLGRAGEERLHSLDYVIVSEGDQGMEWSTGENLKINEYIFARPDHFRIFGLARLPDGPALRIYRIIRP